MTITLSNWLTPSASLSIKRAEVSEDFILAVVNYGAIQNNASQVPYTAVYHFGIPGRKGQMAYAFISHHASNEFNLS
jgi:hypothetical protein